MDMGLIDVTSTHIEAPPGRHHPPRCHKQGHSEATYCAKIRAEATHKGRYLDKKPEPPVDENRDNAPLHQTYTPQGHGQFTVVTDPDPPEKDFVATTKRTADGQALLKQLRSGSVPIPSIFNPDSMRVDHLNSPPKNVRQSTTSKKKPKAGRTKRVSKKAEIAKLVGKCHMLSESTRAPCGLTFGQLIREDADEAKREIRPLFTKKVSRSFLAQVICLPRRLKVLSVLVYGTETRALLDSGAIPNLMSDHLAALPTLSPEATTKTMTVADRTAANVDGTVGQFRVSFAGLKENLYILVVEGSPVNVITRCPALEKLQAGLDVSQQHVTITCNGKTVQLSFEYDNSRFRALESGTDSEYFTSEEIEDSADSDNEGFVVTVLGEVPYEPPRRVDFPQCNIVANGKLVRVA